jgi:membrane protein
MRYRDYWHPQWLAILRRVGAEILIDDCLGASAQLAYYLLLAFFPFVMFLVAIVGFLPWHDSLWHMVLQQVDRLAPLMPAAALGIVRDAVDVLWQRNTALLSVSVLGALFVASNGMRAVMVTLNRAYNVREGRPIWHRHALAVALTLALWFGLIVALLLLSLSERIAAWTAVHVGPGVATAWRISSQVVGVGALFFVVELIYHLAPNVRRPWRWITPGSILAVVLWFLGTEAFTTFVSRFGKYEVMYAGLAAVVVFLVWLYIAAFALLVGGELDAELERSAGLLPAASVPAGEFVDAAGHDTSVRDSWPGTKAGRAETPLPLAPEASRTARRS